VERQARELSAAAQRLLDSTQPRDAGARARDGADAAARSGGLSGGEGADSGADGAEGELAREGAQGLALESALELIEFECDGAMLTMAQLERAMADALRTLRAAIEAQQGAVG
jgi:hypothetical protein